MNFDLTDEQKLFAESVRRFAQAHLAAGALKRAHDPRFPYEVAQLMAKQGLMGIALTEHDGGQGGTLMDAVIAIEQVADVCPRSADVVQFGNFGPIRTFAEYGTEAQKRRWLGDLLAGRMVMSLMNCLAGQGLARRVCEGLPCAAKSGTMIKSLTGQGMILNRKLARRYWGPLTESASGGRIARHMQDRKVIPRASVRCRYVVSPERILPGAFLS